MPTVSLTLTDKQSALLAEATDAYNAHFETSLTPKQFVFQFVMGTVKNWLIAAHTDTERELKEAELNIDLGGSP